MAKQVPALRGRVDYRCKLSVRNLDPPENAYHASVAMRKSEFELRLCSHGDTNDCNSPSALTVYSDCARAENNGRSASLRHRSAKSVDLPGALERTVGQGCNSSMRCEELWRGKGSTHGQLGQTWGQTEGVPLWGTWSHAATGTRRALISRVDLDEIFQRIRTRAPLCHSNMVLSIDAQRRDTRVGEQRLVT